MLKYPKITLSIFIFLAFLWLCNRTVDPDLGWHLRVGEETFTTWTVPRADHFSFTMAGTPWVDHEWLQNAALWRLEAHGLWWVAVLFFAFVASAPFFVWLWRARDLAEIGVVLLAALLLTGFLGVRPQMVGFLFFFLCLEIGSRFFFFCHSRSRSESGVNSSGNPEGMVPSLHSWIPGQAGNDMKHTNPSAETKGRSSKKLLFGILLVALFFVWSNLHAGFAAGLLLIFLMRAGRTVALWLAHKAASLPDIGETAVMAAAALAPVMNPYGMELYREVFRVLGSSATARSIVEWQPAFTVFGSSSLLWVFVGVFLFLAVRYLRVLPPLYVLPAAVFFLGFMRSARMGPLFLVVAVPLLFEGIRYARREIETARSIFPWSARERSLLLGGGALFCIVPLGFLGLAAVRAEPPSFPVEPLRILESRQRSGETIRLFHEYGWGGYIIKAAPDIPVFVDGRMPHWRNREGNSAMEEYLGVLYAGSAGDRTQGEDEAWRAIFEKRGINAVLIRNQERIKPASSFSVSLPPLQKAISALTKDPRFDLETALRKEGWEVPYEDTGAILLTRN